MATRIVGIVLVRNEENFVGWAVRNALDFCDEWIVVDNRSTDGTLAELEGLSRLHPHVRLLQVSDATTTNGLLQEYVGQQVWVFGLDGDEIYDRDGLMRLRERIFAGEFDGIWKLTGHTLHVWEVDLHSSEASGYLTPAAEPATKLYNFAHLAGWRPDRQRLHGSPEVKPEYKQGKLNLGRITAWEACDFRNLHLCFFPRTVGEPDGGRDNITDKFAKHAWRRPLMKLLLALPFVGSAFERYARPRSQTIKQRNYMRGDQVSRGIEGFGRPSRPGVAALLEQVSARRRASDRD